MRRRAIGRSAAKSTACGTGDHLIVAVTQAFEGVFVASPVGLDLHPQLEKHLADMKGLGLQHRDYLRYLLALRYEAMIRGHVALSMPLEASAGRR